MGQFYSVNLFIGYFRQYVVVKVGVMCDILFIIVIVWDYIFNLWFIGDYGFGDVMNCYCLWINRMIGVYQVVYGFDDFFVNDINRGNFNDFFL